VLTAGYAGAVGSAVADSPNKDKITDNLQAELQRSFASATDAADKYPQSGPTSP
jgi:DHA2 family multidrug resistance protein-like MFS transporter